MKVRTLYTLEEPMWVEQLMWMAKEIRGIAEEGAAAAAEWWWRVCNTFATTRISSRGSFDTHGVCRRQVDWNDKRAGRWSAEMTCSWKDRCQTLAKVLPVTVQDLIDGKTARKDVFQTLSSILIQRISRSICTRELSRKTISETWCRNDEQKQWWAQAQQEFQDDLFKRFDMALPSCVVDIP